MTLSGILVIVNVSTKKAVKLTTEECEEIIDDTTTITQNKTIVIKELVENCKPFVSSSTLFLSVSYNINRTFCLFLLQIKVKRCFTKLKKRAPNSSYVNY